MDQMEGSMLNKTLLAQIQKNPDGLKAMTTDCYENPSTYKGWIFILRYFLALRYLKSKQKVLEWFRFKKIYPVPDEDYKQTLIQQLSGNKDYHLDKKAKPSIFAISFKSVLVFPVLLLALGIGAYSVNDWYQLRKIENILANHLPYFSDLLHRKLLLKHNGNDSQREKINVAIEKERLKILNGLPEKDGIRDIIAVQLKRLGVSSTDSEEIMLGFKDVNTVFDKKGMPFYLTPKSFTIPCSSLINASVEQMMMIKKMEELMSGNNPELCRTTMMTVYKVNQRGQLYYSENITNDNSDKTELPLFHVERVDKVPAVDSALGLTFKNHGIGSIILRDRIKLFGEESILPALTFQGRSYIIPYWMQGYYEIEEAVTKGYKKDLYEIYPKKAERLRVKKAVKRIIKNKNRMQTAKMQQTLQRPNENNDTNLFGSSFDAISVLLGKEQKKNQRNQKPEVDLTLDDESKKALLKLEAVLLPSIEYHEAYHQINKKGWVQPAWVETLFKDELSENGVDHTLEELGAYLSQLANTEKGQNIWLSKLLIFSLNPMTKGEAEYYASSIIFNALESLDTGRELIPNFNMSVDKKAEIYKKLIANNSGEIQALTKRAYEILFERDVPVLSR